MEKKKNQTVEKSTRETNKKINHYFPAANLH